MTRLEARLLRYEQAMREANAPRGDEVIGGMTRDELLTRYAGKVAFLARQLAARLPPHSPVDLDDLINTGVIGLLDAVDRFDSTRNVDFGTFAKYRIRGAMLDQLRRLDLVSRHVRDKANRVERTVRQMHAELGRAPESAEVAEALGMSITSYHEMLQQVRSIQLLSLDGSTSSREGEAPRSLAEVVADPDAEAPDASVERAQAIASLSEAIRKSLPERQQQILSMYYEREMSLAEIAMVFEVSVPRISQLHTEACLRLRAQLAPSLRPGESFQGKRPRARRGRR